MRGTLALPGRGGSQIMVVLITAISTLKIPMSNFSHLSSVFQVTEEYFGLTNSTSRLIY
jgi:hypothetical protein